MAFDLIDTLKNLFSREFAGKTAVQLGESESNVQKALGAIIPSVLAGLLNKAGNGDTVGVVGMIKDAAGTSVGDISNPGAGLPGGLLAKGADILRSLFGSKAGELSASIANYSGIKASSADTLLQTAAPAALGVIGNHASADRMSPAVIIDLLVSQKDKILAMIPSGLGLAGILGVGSLSDISTRLTGVAGRIRDTSNSTVHHAPPETGGNRWVTWLIVAIALILLVWWLLKGCGNQPHNTAVSDSVTVAETHEVAPAAMERESIKVTLPDGVVLDAYKGGIEDQLVMFLNDPNSKGGKDVWFDFDNLNFNTGSAEITAESNVQVSNLAAILNAYPKTKIKIGGYTDKTGDAAVNKKLSQDRAEAVHNALTQRNTKAAQLLGAEGYGSEFAKAAADAPDEERKKDRRISVGVREK